MNLVDLNLSSVTWPVLVVYVNMADEFSYVFHVVYLIHCILIKFSVLTVMSIEFCSIININTDNNL